MNNKIYDFEKTTYLLNVALIRLIREKKVFQIEKAITYEPTNLNEALVYAISHNFREAVSLLLKAGAKINFNEAVKNIELLVNCGFDINQVNEENNTILLFSANHQSLKLITYLIENGANINYINRLNKKSVFDAAFENSNDKILLYLNEVIIEKEKEILEKAMLGEFNINSTSKIIKV